MTWASVSFAQKWPLEMSFSFIEYISEPVPYYFYWISSISSSIYRNKNKKIIKYTVVDNCKIVMKRLMWTGCAAAVTYENQWWTGENMWRWWCTYTHRYTQVNGRRFFSCDCVCSQSKTTSALIRFVISLQIFGADDVVCTRIYGRVQ